LELLVFQLKRGENIAQMIKIRDLKLIRVVGTGAFGEVYLARLKSDPKAMFAIKILEWRKMLKQRLADQLENEINVLRRLHGSPFITKQFSTDYCGGRIGIVLEYVSGGELFYWLKKFGRFSEYSTVFYASEIVCALKYIHEHGILYRDLKPENVLITASGHIKLIDFGFAVQENEKTYVISGTPEYMSPEKLKSEGDGRESDYWGLGVMIYEMLCGDPPFYDLSADVIYRKILEMQVAFPSYVNPAARSLVLSLLDKNRSSRLGFGGIEEIMNHPFFAGINWCDVENRRLSPPFVPRAGKVVDTKGSGIRIEECGEAEEKVCKPYRNIKNFGSSL
jgi:serine/threonine protein kinase